MKIFVGRLSPAVTDLHLELLFGYFGEVNSANVVKDRQTGSSRQFGFVDMKYEKEAAKAIRELDGAPLEGSKIVVNEAVG